GLALAAHLALQPGEVVLDVVMRRRDAGRRRTRDGARVAGGLPAAPGPPLLVQLALLLELPAPPVRAGDLRGRVDAAADEGDEHDRGDKAEKHVDQRVDDEEHDDPADHDGADLQPVHTAAPFYWVYLDNNQVRESGRLEAASART